MSAPFRAPWWLPERHSQTIWTALAAPRPHVDYRRERWDTPDGDFIDVDHVDQPRDAPVDRRPRLVVFHGLEGDSRSPYALHLMAAARERGWRGSVAHFRGCSGEPNRLARAYHSGDSDEIDWIVRRLRQRMRADGEDGPLFACGISLGGNALLKWLGERGDEAGQFIEAGAGVSAPQDLAAGADALARGFSRLYTRNFLRTLVGKSLAKLDTHPGLYDAERVRAARTFHEFDDLVTAPLHGFADCHDYWQRSSCKQYLGGVRVPTLVVNALNDPFVPARVLATPGDVSPRVTLDYPASGGHVGFAAGSLPGRFDWLPARVLAFLDRR